MSMPPRWLPEMVNVNGEPDKVFAMLHGIFDADFRRYGRQLLSLPVWWDRRVIDPPYEEGFWHLITRKDYGSGDRLLDFRRAERLPWCGPTITNCSEECVKVWDYEEGDRRVRTYVWLEAYDYVVILEKQAKRVGTVAYLITAFHVDGKQKREDLERKYRKRQP
jgi:hypothetical protein